MWSRAATPGERSIERIPAPMLSKILCIPALLLLVAACGTDADARMGPIRTQQPMRQVMTPDAQAVLRNLLAKAANCAEQPPKETGTVLLSSWIWTRRR